MPISFASPKRCRPTPPLSVSAILTKQETLKEEEFEEESAKPSFNFKSYMLQNPTKPNHRPFAGHAGGMPLRDDPRRLAVYGQRRVVCGMVVQYCHEFGQEVVGEAICLMMLSKGANSWGHIVFSYQLEELEGSKV
ncbi:geranylgeranyl pyrophosphate synthase chloroplastic [Prunus yedoensis var. nudiflora]|uniref:Geranylgeranyl pyrophosphate synthase chloroplastic n=1 Tax=Prunus yedoensis var. nudiflora TaxID=2094558 RepID=A0A314ZA22_PRUYE|nr:geranylgeranyl pyrophosphate synthase chloroplastic [Prunus yedoensis var. nudiflora]